MALERLAGLLFERDGLTFQLEPRWEQVPPEMLVEVIRALTEDPEADFPWLEAEGAMNDAELLAYAEQRLSEVTAEELRSMSEDELAELVILSRLGQVAIPWDEMNDDECGD